MGSDITVEHEIDVAKLNKLLDEATRGPWRIDRGLMADSLWITAYEREGIGRKDGDGPICHVSQTKRHYESNRDRFGNRRGKSRSWETPIKKARTDAELIVAAVNALPELLRRLKLDIDETGWLIEQSADKFGPVRWYAISRRWFSRLSRSPSPIMATGDWRRRSCSSPDWPRT